MKNYVVNFEREGTIVSTFQVNANSLAEAREIAQSHKRLEGFKRVKTVVYLKR